MAREARGQLIRGNQGLSSFRVLLTYYTLLYHMDTLGGSLNMQQAIWQQAIAHMATGNRLYGNKQQAIWQQAIWQRAK